MSTVEQLYEEALKLPPADREALGQRILESALPGLDLDSPSGKEEIRRRINAYHAGTAGSVPLEMVLERARSVIRASP
jgi:putative addiction module component (TIGR02574 family)